MSASTPAEAALLAHVLSQLHSNVDFLVEQQYIAPADAAAIRGRLPTEVHAIISPPAPSFPTSRTPSTHMPAPPARSPAPPPAAPKPVRARAVWGYNEDGAEPNDLSFGPGDIIEITAEENGDWWSGRYRGRTGLFPSNHVEKLADGPSPASPSPAGFARMMPPAPNFPTGPVSAPYAAPAPPYNNSQVMMTQEKPMYRPFGAAHHGADVPPPQGTNTVGLQQVNQEEKKNKISGLKNTLAHSAAGGVGFGAGAAIGGGLINAIF